MTSKIINILGKEIGLAYCFATEIGFKKIAGVTIDEFNAKDQEHAISLIIAAVIAYYQDKEEDTPITSEDLMYKCKPNELINAMKTIFELRREWYELPFEDDDEEEVKEGDSKND